MMMHPKQPRRFVAAAILWLCGVADGSARSPFTEDALRVLDASAYACGRHKISAQSDRIEAATEIEACTRLIDVTSLHGSQLDRASALDERARSYVIVGDVQKGLADSDAALALDPSAQDHYDTRIWIDLFLRRFDDLIHDATRELGVFKGNVVVQADRGWAYIYVRDYAAAIRSFGSLLAVQPGNSGLRNGRCEAFALVGQEQDAFRDCSIGLALPHNGKNLSDTMGYVYLRLQRWQDAVIQYGQVLRMEPNAPKALYGRGLAMYRMGKVAQAGGAADIEAAKRIDPHIDMDFADDP